MRRTVKDLLVDAAFMVDLADAALLVGDEGAWIMPLADG